MAGTVTVTILVEVDSGRRQWGRQFVVMSALLEFATALLTAARGVIAAFGCLCLVVHVVVPCVATVGEFMIYTVPSEVANWRLQWAQESELQALEDRVTVLKKQRVMQMKREARRALEQQKALSQSRRTTETRRRSTAASRKAVPEPEEVVQMLPPVQPEVTDRVPSNEPTERVGRTLKKPSVFPRRSSQPLQLLSPNVPREQRVPAYVKASAAVSKPTESDRSNHSTHPPPFNKGRILSLGNIFDDVEDENVPPVSRMWAQ